MSITLYDTFLQIFFRSRGRSLPSIEALCQARFRKVAGADASRFRDLHWAGRSCLLSAQRPGRLQTPLKVG